MLSRLISCAGLGVFITVAYILSDNRKNIQWRLVAWGAALQLIFALLILKTRGGMLVFTAARIVVDTLIGFSDKGASFLFGALVSDTTIGAVMAFRVMPVIVFVSSLAGILYYLGVIQFVVKIMARIMHATMKTSGAESLGAGLMVFMGIESLTAIRTYIKNMTRSELFTLMSAFMATIASSVMATYATFGAEPGHLLAASIMSAPAAVMIAKIMIPETESPETLGTVGFTAEKTDNTLIEAAANGASAGMNLVLQIGAMLIAFISLIWLVNSVFGLFHTSLEQILGYLFSPFAFIMGVPFSEAVTIGKLLGTKTVFNEFLAYVKLQEMISAGMLSPRSIVIATYALCGFANFGSVAILIGGIGAIAPEKKGTAASLGIRSLISGTIACFMTAAIAGLLL